METEEKQLRSYLRVMYMNKGLIISMTFVFAIISAVISLFLQPVFTASATMMPSNQSSSSGMSGLLSLTSQFGFADMPQNDPSKLLFDIIHSNIFIDKILRKQFFFKKLGGSSTFYGYAEVPDTGATIERYHLLESFKTNIEMESVKGSELIEIKISAPEPQLAKDLADTIIHELNIFYEKLRSSKKTKYRILVGRNLKEAGFELEQTEDSLASFMQQNMDFSTSPRLLLEQQRITREVKVKQEVFLTIRKSFELARLEEQKELNALEILDQPETPVFKAKPQRRKIVMFFSFLGFIIGSLAAFFIENRLLISGIYHDITGKGK